MLDRLMRRAVLAEPDRIVGQHEDHALAHQRGEPDRRPAVVGEDEEGAAVGDHALVQRHAVHRGRHRVLADAEMDVAAGRLARAQDRGRLGLGVVGAGEVGRAADQLRHGCGEDLERLLARLAARPGRLLGDQPRLVVGQHLVEALGQLARMDPLELGALRRVLRARAARSRRSARRRRGGRSRARRRGCGRGSRTADGASRASRARRRSPRRRAASRGSQPCRPWSARRSRSSCGRRSGSAGRRPAPRASAASIAAGSWPSIRVACQP